MEKTTVKNHERGRLHKKIFFGQGTPVFIGAGSQSFSPKTRAFPENHNERKTTAKQR